MRTTLFMDHAVGIVDPAETALAIEKNAELIGRVQRGEAWNDGWLGWFAVSESFPEKVAEAVEEAAERVRRTADLMIVIGIGGSNRGAMAAIHALRRSVSSPTRIEFAGDTMSAAELMEAVESAKSHSTVLNVIAKDFRTLEPGIAFRILRAAMMEKYGEAHRDRIIVTGSRGSGQLGELAEKHGYRFLDFPANIGGRFSVLSAVALFPMAVAGIDIGLLVRGAKGAEAALKSTDIRSNPAVRYAVDRSILFSKGFFVESLVFFEPALQHFARWWIQLFAETEGKNGKAVLPTCFSYSEDLHAVGQFVQQGTRCVSETYLNYFYRDSGLMIGGSESVRDGFEYLDGKKFDELNRAVYAAALQAHSEAGVPCVEIAASPIDEESLGELFYFFLFAAYLSGSLLGVDPFTQDGVEGYKKNMRRLLGKDRT